MTVRHAPATHATPLASAAAVARLRAARAARPQPPTSLMTALAVAALGLAACGADPSDGAASGDACAGAASAADPVIPCEVASVLRAKCRRCHLPRTEACGGELGTCLRAPFSLDTWEDFQATREGRKVYELSRAAVEGGSMPMLVPGQEPPVAPLTEDEERVLLEWTRACAPAADGVTCQ